MGIDESADPTFEETVALWHGRARRVTDVLVRATADDVARTCDPDDGPMWPPIKPANAVRRCLGVVFDETWAHHRFDARDSKRSGLPNVPVGSVAAVTRVLSCMQPTGELHLGNYLGAFRNWVKGQHEKDVFHGIVDLHSLTISEEPGVVANRTMELAAIFFGVGLDPDVATIFVQSHVPEHAQLAWLMECNVSYGELSRMTQFKDKSAKRDGEFISGGLFTYPALMAADILLYDTDEVPVGDDQRQHVEITRDIAERFNHRFGDTFVIPEAVIPPVGARIMDLQDPTSKMSKSANSDAGTIRMLDEPDAIAKKFKRAVTDSDNEVRFDREHKPGVSNLLEVLASITGEKPEEVAGRYTQYGPLKIDAGDAVVELLRPVQERAKALLADRSELAALLHKGAEKAAAVASVTLERAYHNVGLLPR